MEFICVSYSCTNTLGLQAILEYFWSTCVSTVPHYLRSAIAFCSSDFMSALKKSFWGAWGTVWMRTEANCCCSNRVVTPAQWQLSPTVTATSCFHWGRQPSTRHSKQSDGNPAGDTGRLSHKNLCVPAQTESK